MNTTLVHILRDEQPIGSYPAWIVPHLVEVCQINPEDRWYCEGMQEALDVSVLVEALRPKKEKTTDSIARAALAKEPSKFRAANVPFIDVVLVVFKVLLALLIASPAVVLIYVIVLGIAGGIGARLLGH